MGADFLTAHGCVVNLGKLCHLQSNVSVISVADPGGGGGGGAEGAYAPPNKPTQNMNLIIVEQIAMRACTRRAGLPPRLVG